MSNVLVENQSLTDIANAIRAQLGVQTTFKPGQMASAISNISGEGSLTPFAVVEAFYTLGAQCYVSNGTLTIYAPDASGKALFAIPRPSSLPETWTFTTIYNGNTMTRDLVITSDDEHQVIRSFYTGNANELKVFMKETSYCRLSNAIGDKEKFSDRWMQRTSEEPIIFVSYQNYSGEYRGYGAITKSNVIPGQTYSQSGELRKNTECETITIGNNVFYWYQMSGQLSGSFSSIEYTTDGVAEHFTNDLYIRLRVEDGHYVLKVTASSDEIAEEFENLCDLYASLP